jgi:tRNA G37 N-methylase TrmD
VQALRRTLRRRPDLLESHALTDEERALLREAEVDGPEE